MEILFNNFAEAKKKSIELMKEEKIMGVMIGKKRSQDIWFVDYRVCSEEYYEKFIKNTLTN